MISFPPKFLRYLLKLLDREIGACGLDTRAGMEAATAKAIVETALEEIRERPRIKLPDLQNYFALPPLCWAKEPNLGVLVIALTLTENCEVICFKIDELKEQGSAACRASFKLAEMTARASRKRKGKKS